jgi:peptidoglycan/xylan/chitin deacetylase (PgdA/CDA1 family)
MRFYWVKTHRLVKKIFSGFTWSFPTKEKVVYLTFDDGPTPEITDWTLSLLKQYDAKATFFCIGENISQHPNVFKRIKEAGHSIGNHTYNHLNGWHSSNDVYFNNIVKCEEVIDTYSGKLTLQEKLFRPPYGKITLKQFKFLKKRKYKVIMWDVLSADFDTKITPDQCAQNVLKNIQPGSILIFHDSIKASKNLKYALPQTLEYLQRNGYKMSAIGFAPEPKR